MQKNILISLFISLAIIGGAVLFRGTSSNTESGVAIMEDGKQFIDISAGGGYSPSIVTAKAGVPTILRVKTSGTFDCSASLAIPKLSYQKFLQPSGVEEITIPPEKAVGTLQGLCGMGMYNFQVKFN
ncbi:MAG: cupredoxin domain-containing protein [Patescibacteria group bacterium]